MSSTSAIARASLNGLRSASALGLLLERPGFGAGPATVGAELELFLVNGTARPRPSTAPHVPNLENS